MDEFTTEEHRLCHFLDKKYPKPLFKLEMVAMTAMPAMSVVTTPQFSFVRGHKSY